MTMFATIPNPSRQIPTQQVTLARVLQPDLLCDYEANDLALDASGDLVLADGTRGWVQCWVNRLIIQQGAHPIYPRSLGIDHERYMRRPTRARIQAEYTGRIKRQAAREQGTFQVRNFSFDWQGDTCSLSVVIVSINGDTVPMGVSLRA